MSDPALATILVGGELLVASTAILGAAFAAARAVGDRPSLRHLVWLTAFGSLLLLPLLATVIPAGMLFEAPAAASTPSAGPAPGAGGFGLAAGLLVLAAAVWLAGAAWNGLRAATAAFGLRALRRRSVPLDSAALGVGPLPIPDHPWELRISEGSDGPLTWGVVRPIVLLPQAALDWPKARLRTALLHELAHVRRRDSLSQALALAACALYWPNPLVWAGFRALRREAELSADDAVLAAGVRPTDYAADLLALAAPLKARPLSAVPMADTALGTRVASILAPTRHRTGATTMDAVKIAGLGVLAAGLLVAARPGLAAAEAPSAPPAPPSPPTVRVAPPAPPAVRVAPRPPAAPAAPAPPSPPRLAILPDVAQADRDVLRNSPTPIPETRVPLGDGVMNDDTRKALADIGPQVEKALAEARIGETVAKALAEARIGETVQKALAEARIEETVQKALAAAQPQIDAAVADARREAEKARDR